MSNQYNTDGMLVLPSNGNESSLTMNALESIECAIAFDVRCWTEERRSAWIDVIVFGADNENWDELARKYKWDEEDRKRAEAFHAQWVKARVWIDEGMKI